MIINMMNKLRDAMMLLCLTLISKTVNGFKQCGSKTSAASEGVAYCLSWRLAVEANNVRAWRTVPTQCQRHIETYMVRGQYEKDLELIMGQVSSFADEIVLSDDGFDAWVFDIDDTCISNLQFYRRKRFGCDPYDPLGFREWALSGECPAVPSVLETFNKLVDQGFKVFLLTGRDEETLGYATVSNLQNEGYVGYERVLLRRPENKGQSASDYKSSVRKKLVEEGYRLWGNVGDQWSDLQGDFLGNRTFKLPNPMYFMGVTTEANEGEADFLSWRLAMEANNVRGWKTVPTQYQSHIETYIVGGQYEKDLEFIMGQISSFADEIILSDDGLDAWIFDIDDTCISNIPFYGQKRFGCDPFDRMGFISWVLTGGCPAIPSVLKTFNKLVERGFKVFLLSGRDEETLRYATLNNLQNQGFVGYERVILRKAENKGQCASDYKSGVRKKLVEEGYRLWGNVGDQWSDLLGDFVGSRTFKLPNPMYFVS